VVAVAARQREDGEGKEVKLLFTGGEEPTQHHSNDPQPRIMSLK